MATHAPIFQAHAAAAGFDLEADVRFGWLTPRGHLDSEVQRHAASATLAALDCILEALEGDADQLAAKTRGSMRADFVLLRHRIHVEYDEVQHFTTARISTLDHYPADAALAFSPDAYRRVAERWRA